MNESHVCRFMVSELPSAHYYVVHQLQKYLPRSQCTKRIQIQKGTTEFLVPTVSLAKVLQ